MSSIYLLWRFAQPHRRSVLRAAWQHSNYFPRLARLCNLVHLRVGLCKTWAAFILLLHLYKIFKNLSTFAPHFLAIFWSLGSTIIRRIKLGVHQACSLKMACQALPVNNNLYFSCHSHEPLPWLGVHCLLQY